MASPNTRAEKHEERKTLNSHASHLSPELRSCEHQLACTIEGVQLNRLLIRFFALDPTDPRRDASFVLDMSSQNYKGKKWVGLRGFVLTLLSHT
jgi:kinetochore protein Spc25